MNFFNTLSDYEKTKIRIFTVCLFFFLIGVVVVLYPSTIIEYFRLIIKTLRPFIIGFVLAALIWKPVKITEKLVARFKKNPRGLSVFLCTIMIGIILIITFGVVVPQIATSIPELIENISTYAEEGVQTIDKIINNLDMDSEIVKSVNNLFSKTINNISSVLFGVLNKTIQAFNTALSFSIDFILSIVISIYILLYKERLFSQTQRLSLALLGEKTTTKLTTIVELSSNIFGNFIIGQAIVSSILSVFCFILMSIFNMENSVLISFIVGISNMIPYFGPFIGAVPGVIILLTTNPIHSLIFIAIVIVLQQIDNAFISPNIVGKKVGLLGIWIIFAIMIFGKLFGIVGMIIGTPSFAIIYNLLAQWVNNRLKSKKSKFS